MMQMEEEEEAMLEFSENNYANYYVQSPSSVSYTNYITTTRTTATDTDQLLSRNNSSYNPQFLLITMPNYRHSPLDDHPSMSMSMSMSANVVNNSIGNNNNNNNNTVNLSIRAATETAIVTAKKQRKIDVEEDETWNEYGENNERGKSSSYWQYLSLDTYPSSYVWIGLQIFWRMLVSVMLALLVFYIVTKPPPPHVSLQVRRVNQFELTQGLDSTGVATTFLRCNISMGLIVDNKSKVFGLHIMSPTVNVYFDRVSFILSQGPRVYVKSQEWKEMEVYAGTKKKKAMYGGGRNMEDMLNSGQGLPLHVNLTFSSYFRVVPNLIHSHFHHHGHCLLILHHLHHNNVVHHSPNYNSTCLVTS